MQRPWQAEAVGGSEIIRAESILPAVAWDQHAPAKPSGSHPDEGTSGGVVKGQSKSSTNASGPSDQKWQRDWIGWRRLSRLRRRMTRVAALLCRGSTSVKVGVSAIQSNRLEYEHTQVRFGEQQRCRLLPPQFQSPLHQSCPTAQSCRVVARSAASRRDRSDSPPHLRYRATDIAAAD
jgi:hypothetical protein